jgi:hypothetical protein
MRNKWKMENGKRKNPNLAGAQSSTGLLQDWDEK